MPQGNSYADAPRDSNNIPDYAVKGPVWDKPGSGPDLPALVKDVFGTNDKKERRASDDDAKVKGIPEGVITGPVFDDPKNSPLPDVTSVTAPDGALSSGDKSKRLLGGDDPETYKKYGIPDNAVKGPIFDKPGSDPVSKLLGVGQGSQPGKRFDPNSLPKGTVVGPVYDKPGSDPVSQTLGGLLGQSNGEGRQPAKRFDPNSLPKGTVVGPVYDKPGSDPVSKLLGVGQGTQPGKRFDPNSLPKGTVVGPVYDKPGSDPVSKLLGVGQGSQPGKRFDPNSLPKGTVVGPVFDKPGSDPVSQLLGGIVGQSNGKGAQPAKRCTSYKDIGNNQKYDVKGAEDYTKRGEEPGGSAAEQGIKYFPLNPQGDYSLVNPSNSFSPANGLSNGLSDVGSHLGLHQGNDQKQSQGQSQQQSQGQAQQQSAQPQQPSVANPARRQFGVSGGLGNAPGGSGGAGGLGGAGAAPGGSGGQAAGGAFSNPFASLSPQGLGGAQNLGGTGNAQSPQQSAQQPSLANPARRQFDFSGGLGNAPGGAGGAGGFGGAGAAPGGSAPGGSGGQAAGGAFSNPFASLSPQGMGGAQNFGGTGDAKGTTPGTPAPGSAPEDALGSGGAADGYSNFLDPTGSLSGSGSGGGAAPGGAAPGGAASGGAAPGGAAPAPAAAPARREQFDVTVTERVTQTVTETVDPVTYQGPTPSGAAGQQQQQQQQQQQGQAANGQAAPTAPAAPLQRRSFTAQAQGPVQLAGGASERLTLPAQDAGGEGIDAASVFVIAVLASFLATSVFSFFLLKVRRSLQNQNRIKLEEATDDDDEDRHSEIKQV